MPSEKRIARRKALNYPARIDAGDGALRDCVLCDISETGARVALLSSDAVPEQFTLLMGTQGAAPRNCKVAWRRGDELGLQFKKERRA